MYLDNLEKSIDYQGHKSKVKVTWVFLCVSCSCLLTYLLARMHTETLVANVLTQDFMFV